MSDIAKKRVTSKRPAAFMPPLFDRLISGDLQLLDEEAMRRSVQDELKRMLVARMRIRPLLLGGEEGEEAFITLYPGENPETTPWEEAFEDPQNQALWNQVEAYFEMCIRAFEPRLHHPQVSVESFDTSTQSLCLSIQGQLKLGDRTELISFPLAIGASDRFSA